MFRDPDQWAMHGMQVALETKVRELSATMLAVQQQRNDMKAALKGFKTRAEDAESRVTVLETEIGVASAAKLDEANARADSAERAAVTLREEIATLAARVRAARIVLYVCPKNPLYLLG